MEKAAPPGEAAPVISKLSLAAFILGLISIAFMPIVVLAAIRIEMIGFVDLMRGIVMPLSGAAVVTGIISANKLPPEDLKSRQLARLGIILGAAAFSLVILFIAAVALFFLPFLWV